MRCSKSSVVAGFGIVFRAFDETLQRVVAVKVLAPPVGRFLSPTQTVSP